MNTLRDSKKLNLKSDAQDEEPRLRRTEDHDASDYSSHDPLNVQKQSKPRGSNGHLKSKHRRKTPASNDLDASSDGTSPAAAEASQITASMNSRAVGSREKVSSLFAFSQEIFESLPTLTISKLSPSTQRQPHNLSFVDDISSENVSAVDHTVAETDLERRKSRSRKRVDRGSHAS